MKVNYSFGKKMTVLGGSNLVLKSCTMTSCIYNFQEEGVWQSLFTLENV